MTERPRYQEYVYEMRCEFCNVFLCWWRYSGPFHGNLCCDACKNEDTTK